MPRNRIAAAVAAAALAGGGAGAGVVVLTHGGGSTATRTTTVVTGTSNVASAGLTVGAVAKAATKGVVEIDATTSGTQSPFPGGGGGSSAEGTGFVYDESGDILTNQHVIDGATSVKVKFWDGSTYTATVVGSDPSTDVAVLNVKAPASKLFPLRLADSSRVQVGDGVVAIGNPFGLDNTVTSGIVSAVDRQITAPDSAPIEGAIQTDAAINHGNSGGPLLDMQAKVIGITSQIQSEGGGNDGVGFAIPANLVKSIAEQILADGSVQHALLGVTPTDANGGVGVSEVQTGSAADDAGIQVGDVITSIDGRKVTSSTQLRAIISSHKPGDKIAVTVERGNGTKTLHATLGSRS